MGIPPICICEGQDSDQREDPCVTLRVVLRFHRPLISFHMLRRGWFGRAMEVSFVLFVQPEYISDSQWANEHVLYVSAKRENPGLAPRKALDLTSHPLLDILLALLISSISRDPTPSGVM